MAHLCHEDKLKYTNFFLAADEELGDGDGALDIEEFEKLLVISSGHKFSKADVAAAFADTDTDGNRKITLDEFLAKLPHMSFSPSTRALARTIKSKFNELDVDKDGFVRYEDMRNGLTNLYGRIEGDMLEEFLEEWDKDGDGRLNFQEFAVMYIDTVMGDSDVNNIDEEKQGELEEKTAGKDKKKKDKGDGQAMKEEEVHPHEQEEEKPREEKDKDVKETEQAKKKQLYKSMRKEVKIV